MIISILCTKEKLTQIHRLKYHIIMCIIVVFHRRPESSLKDSTFNTISRKRRSFKQLREDWRQRLLQLFALNTIIPERGAGSAQLPPDSSTLTLCKLDSSSSFGLSTCYTPNVLNDGIFQELVESKGD